MAVGEMSANPAGLRKNDPNLIGAVGEIEFHFQIEMRGGIGIGSGFDGESRRAFEISTRPRAPKLRCPWEAHVRLHPCIFRELKARFYTHIAEPVLINVGLQDV